jgi:uncharacterized protein YggE
MIPKIIKLSYVFVLLFLCFTKNSFAQTLGNASYKYNKSTNPATVYQQIVSQGDSAMVVEAAVLSNELADSFVLIFGVSQEGKTVAEATLAINKRLAGLVEELKLLKISEKDFYIDLITQNRVYDYELNATNTVAKEKLVGFEIKKNISIHFSNREMIDKITVAASKFEIFDLIKVDYVKTNTEEIRQKLLEEVTQIITRKKEQYLKISGVKLQATSRILIEDFAIKQPATMYETYNAYASNTISDDYDSYDNRIKKVSLRKITTAYFSPTDYTLFDRVLQPIVIEPVIQYSLRMVVKFAISKN